MARLALAVLTLLEYVVLLYALTTCNHRPCRSPRYCELSVGTRNNLYGSCVSSYLHVRHRYPRCNTASVPKAGTRCYCSTQNCVDKFEKMVHIGTHGLLCKGHLCDDRNQYCELLTNSKGVQGSCVTKTSTLHETACSNVVSRQPCLCNTQTCIDAMFKSYTDSPHLNCQGLKCLEGEYCILTTVSEGRGVCTDGKNIKVPACNDATVDGIASCYCNNQQCIYNFILKANIAEERVKCGRHYCDLDDEEVCQLVNDGRIHHYGDDDDDDYDDDDDDGLLSHVKYRCVDEDQRNLSACTAFPLKDESCSCVNQVCVDSYSNACKDAKNKATCDRYEGASHMCESTDPHFLSLAQGRCLQYCKSCVTGQSMSANTTPSTTDSTTTSTTDSTTPSTTDSSTLSTNQYFTQNKVSTAVPTTTASTTIISTTQRDYTICVDIQCDKYFPYCHIYELKTYVEGRCVPFKVGKSCNSLNDLVGQGCTCSNSSCSLNILSLHEKLVTHPETTTTSAVATTTMNIPSTVQISTKAQGYECLGDVCSFLKGYCHIYSYNGQLQGRCMPFSVWPVCYQKTDFEKNGCECFSAECVKAMEWVNSATTATPQETTRTTQRRLETTIKMTKSVTSAVPPTSAPTTTQTYKILTSTQGVKQTGMATTKREETTTVEDLCQDKPGVDCQLLNTTNICANPFSHQYCAAFCGHCRFKAISMIVG